MLQRLRGMAFLYYQVQILHAAAVLRAGGNDIDAGRIYAWVTENVRQLCNILFNSIEHTGEQVPQIMGKYLSGLHSRMFA